MLDSVYRRSAAAEVLIAGGGFAALETALALRALAGDRVRLAFIAPSPLMQYRPAATTEAFASGPLLAYDLRAIAAELGAGYHVAKLDSVSPRSRCLRLSTGARLEYDRLVLAIGARAVSAVAGARTFRDQRDVTMLRTLSGEISSGSLSRIVFAVPPGNSWPLPIYELALLASRAALSPGATAEITIVSPERRPLEVFGPHASRRVARALEAAEVSFRGGCAAVAVRRDGALELQADGAVPADAVVSIPQLCAHRITGIPASWWGFVPTDSTGRVEGLEDVFAAGDMTTFPVKQGGLAAQQADRIAEAIAAELGADVKQSDGRRVLQARLIGAAEPLLLRTELDWRGQPNSTIDQAEAGPEGPTKVFGRYVTPYLEQRPPVAA